MQKKAYLNKFSSTAVFCDKTAVLEPYSAIIMVGGFGRRLYPLTEQTPKPLLKIAGKPVLSHIVEKLAHNGILQATLCAYFQPHKIADFMKDWASVSQPNLELNLFVEPEPMGTAGALLYLEYSDSEKPVLITNGDVLSDLDHQELFDWHQSQKNDLTVACRYHTHQVPYGVMDVTLDGRVSGVVEKPTKTYPINTGTYVFNPSILEHLPHEGRLDMTDVITILLEKGFKVGSYLFGSYWIDIGQHDDFAAAQEEFIRRSKKNASEAQHCRDVRDGVSTKQKLTLKSAQAQ